MKRLIVLILLSFSFAPAFSQGATKSLYLKEETYNFGNIPQGKPVFHHFELVNTGKDSLKISNVEASCGCTTPEWDRSAIAPGVQSVIRVGYNAASDGAFSKTVVITANDEKKNIVISGTVFKSPATSAPLNTSVSLLKNTN